LTEEDCAYLLEGFGSEKKATGRSKRVTLGKSSDSKVPCREERGEHPMKVQGRLFLGV